MKQFLARTPDDGRTRPKHVVKVRSCIMDGSIVCEDCIDYISINRISNIFFYLNKSNAARNFCHGEVVPVLN
jgi:hypothetical protein